MHPRRERGATLSSYLALLCLAVLLDVGRGNHEPPGCAVLEAVNLPCEFDLDDQNPAPACRTIKRTPLNPGRFTTSNFDSPDTTIRTVLEYSEDEEFRDLPELDLQLDIFDKTAPIDEYGVDLDISTRNGAITSGRFVFTKKRPDSSFIFPKTMQLENGVIYYFRNYKVRDGCISPRKETFLEYKSEVETRPKRMQSQGYPSPVRELKHADISRNATAMMWLPPLDSGNNRTTHGVDSMPVGYEVVARPKPGLDGSVKPGAVTLVEVVSQEAISLSVLQGQLYEITVRSNNSMGFSQEPRILLARAVGPPQQPRDFTFQINPLNYTNAMGNRVGYLSWQPPLDTGLGEPCGDAAQWAFCSPDQYPLRVVRYELRKVVTDTGTEEPGPPLPLQQPSTEKFVEVDYERSYYKFRVRAGNQQQELLGNFSEFGPVADTISGPPLLSGEPLKMRLLYTPWATNVSGAGVGVLDEEVVDPPQSRGISDYCYTNGSLAGSKCPADDALVDADWSPPDHCARCADPELSVFVDSVYTFKVRAVKEIDHDFSEFDPEDIVIENNLAEILGSIGNWQSLVSLNYTVFRCAARADDQHASDQAACDEVNRTQAVPRGRNGYGWKEVSVSFTATKEMAAQGFVANMAFTAITPTNKRSKITVRVRAIRPDPQFFEFTRRHQATMGCVFTTDVTAEDRTELRLSRQTALEKNYLVGISSIGGLMRSAYRETPFPALPAGAQLFPQGLTQPTNNSITYRFQWTPRRFQEGFTYIVNLQARGFLGNTSVPGVEGSPLREISLEINVLRCRFCTENADEVSLSTLASEWRASWLSIWSGNHVLVDPDSVEETTVQLGPVVKVASTQGCDRDKLGDFCNDDLSHISSRYGVSVKDLLWWNPDLYDEAGGKDNYQLYENQEICVLPNTCVNSGHIYSGGF